MERRPGSAGRIVLDTEARAGAVGEGGRVWRDIVDPAPPCASQIASTSPAGSAAMPPINASTPVAGKGAVTKSDLCLLSSET